MKATTCSYCSAAAKTRRPPLERRCSCSRIQAVTSPGRSSPCGGGLVPGRLAAGGRRGAASARRGRVASLRRRVRAGAGTRSGRWCCATRRWPTGPGRRGRRGPGAAGRSSLGHRGSVAAVTGTGSRCYHGLGGLLAAQRPLAGWRPSRPCAPHPTRRRSPSWSRCSASWTMPTAPSTIVRRAPTTALACCWRSMAWAISGA